MRTSVQRGGLGLVGILLLLAGLAVLSARTGGPVSWHVTSGGSMQPGIQPGTLVVVARQATYAVGDVVAYPSEELRGQVVLHRVVELDGQRMVLRGDANSWLDPERPLPEEALGARVLQVGGVGPALAWLGQPAPMGAGVAMMALPFLGKERRRRRRSGPQGGYTRHGLPASGPTWTDDDGEAHAASSPASTAFRLPTSGLTWDPDPDPDLPEAAELEVEQQRAAPATRQTTAAKPLRDNSLVARLRVLKVPAQVETGLFAFALACGLLAASTTGGPLLRTSSASQPAEHVVTWSYGADVAPGLVYDQGVVETGDTLYNRLVQAADVAAELAVVVPGQTPVVGTWRLDVAVADDSGWSRTTSTGRPVEVTAGVQRMDVNVPVADLLALAEQASAESGVEGSGRQISVTAVLDLEVGTQGQQVPVQATPSLVFSADEDKVRLAADSELEQHSAIALPSTGSTKAVQLAGVTFPTQATQLLAGLAAAVALGALALLRLARREEDEDARITRTAGHLLVPMEDLGEPERTVDVRSFEALTAIAASYDRMVLFGDHDGLRVYLVLDDGVAYRYYSAATVARLDAARDAAAAAPESCPRGDSHGDVQVPGQRTPDAERLPR